MRSGAFLNSSIRDYHLIDFLGAGGMGEVYRGVHSKIGRVVAVKILTGAAGNPGMIERFLNEARIQATLHHPNIAALYDLVELNGQHCIIMEYIDGHTLYDRIKASGVPPLSETVFIFQAVVEAVNYMHTHGIIHRDIKSNNIKISSKGEVKLLDFGIAKSESTPQLTVAGDVVGTLQYLSPEQLKGGVADARSDIWALGVLLYEMVTGQAPFEAPTIGTLCERIMKANYPAPSTLNPAAPREVETIVSRALKKNPSDRYRSAQELLRDTVQLNRLVSTPRLSSIDHTRPAKARFDWGLLKRNRTVFAIAAALVLVITAGLFIAIGIKPDPTPVQAGNRQPANSNISTAQTKKIRISVTEGSAEVYRDNNPIGKTPLTIDAKVGERIDLVLKQAGYQDKLAPPIVVGPNSDSKPFTFTMDRR